MNKSGNITKQSTVTQLPRFVDHKDDQWPPDTPDSPRFAPVSSAPEKHPAVKATSLWSCLGIDDASDDSAADDTLAEMTPLGTPRDQLSSAVSGDSDAEEIANIRNPEGAADAQPAPGVVPVLDDAAIAELKTALATEAKYWSAKYNPDPQGTPDGQGKHDPAFKKAIDDYVQGLKHFHQEVDEGKFTVAGLLERSNQLGTMWLRAVGLADANGFTETTSLCMKDAAEAYAAPSVTANEWNIGAGVVRGALLAGASVTCALTGVGSPLLPLYIKSGVNLGYMAVQLGFSVMLPLQNAAAQSGAVKRQAQWGPLFNASLESSRCVRPDGKDHKLRTLSKVQAEFDELSKVNALFGQATCDPAEVLEARQKADHRQHKYLHRLDRKIASLRKHLKNAKDDGQDIGDAGEKVLAATDPLLALAAAQGLMKTIHQPAATWYARTEALRKQHDLYALVVAQLDHVHAHAILDRATMVTDEGLVSINRETLTSLLEEAPPVLTPRVTQILDRATSVSDEGAANINQKTLANVLQETPAPITQRLTDLTWELATTDRYETLNVLRYQGHSRAARNALNLLAALFSLIGNAQDLATVEQDTKELVAAIAKASAEVVAESAASFFGDHLHVAAELMKSVRAILDMAEESKWDILSWLTLLAQPRIYACTQPVGTRHDMENKLATQAQISAMTNHGQILKDGKVNPAGLDAVMKGSMKVRMDHFKKTLEFDSKVYLNALWALLADKDHVTTANAVAVDIPDPGDPGKTITVSCTWTGLNAALGRFKKPEDRNERAALIKALGESRQLTPADMQSLGTLLALYEQNLVNIDHAGNNNLQALLGPGSTLPEASRTLLASSLRHAQAPKHLPPSDPRHAEVQAYLQSATGKFDARQDDLLAEKFGQTERRTNTGNINQSAQKMGQSYMWLIAGSGGPTTVKAIATGVSEGLQMVGGYTDPTLNKAALGVKVAGNLISITGSFIGLFLGYSYHKFILQKNLDRVRDVELQVPSVANSSVLSIGDRDFMTLLSLDRIQGRVSHHETLLAAPIPAATLPAPLQDFKQFVMQLLPAFLGQGNTEAGAPTLPPLPAMPYESKTTFVHDVLVQMKAAPLSEMFRYWSMPHGGLTDITPEDIETIVKEAAAAIYEREKAAQATRDDEEGVSGDGDDLDDTAQESDSAQQRIDPASFEPVLAPQAIDRQRAIEHAQEEGFWFVHHMDPEERDARVRERVMYVERNPHEREGALRMLRQVQENLGNLLAEENVQLPEDLVMTIQQSHDVAAQTLRQLVTQGAGKRLDA